MKKRDNRNGSLKKGTFFTGLLTVLNAKPNPAKNYRMRDRGHSGLYVDVRKTRGKYWRFRYRFPKNGPEQVLSFGPFPELSLEQARILWADAKKKLANGINPGAGKKEQGMTFEAVALEWFDMKSPNYSSGHARTVILRLRKYLFPKICKKIVSSVTAGDLLEIARDLEKRDLRETAHRVVGEASKVFDYAIQTERAQTNVARVMRGGLLPVHENHMAALTDPEDVGRLMLDMERYPARLYSIYCALNLSPLLMLRPGETRLLEWNHIDFEAKEIRLPIEHMKRRQTEKEARRGELAHIVPLSKQSFEML